MILWSSSQDVRDVKEHFGLCEAKTKFLALGRKYSLNWSSNLYQHMLTISNYQKEIIIDFPVAAYLKHVGINNLCMALVKIWSVSLLK